MTDTLYTPEDLARVVNAVTTIPAELFDRYEGSREDEIVTALLDAVFSIRAQYDAKTEGLGVSGRLNTFRSKHPDALNDLRRLTEIGDPEVEEVMGHAQTSSRTKASAAVEAADRLVAAGVVTAADLRALTGSDEDRQCAIENAYTGVHGLGHVTYEYLLMLVGVPGVKSDVMIRRFVAESLGLPRGEHDVSPARAHALVSAAHGQLTGSEHYPENLTAFDHAIWLHQRSR